jgi:phosphatidate cytidylyltransferase
MAVACLGVCWEWTALCKGRALALLAGFGYAGLATASLAWLRADPASGRMALLFLLVVVWSSDIGAYAAGRLIGGRRLAPTISPGKTWSGAVGGLLAAIVGGEVMAWGGDPARAALVAAALGVASQVGDLLESAVKRHFGVKDTGRLIPGHGGVLDRLDGLMAAALVAGGWALATGQGSAIWR